MSLGTFCGQDPNDAGTFQRVLAKYLDASVQPAQQDLASVLAVGNDANHTAITNGGAFGCSAISAPFGYIDSLDATELSDITNVLGLKINPVGALKIKGAETKGNILVGDGTNTVGVAVGTNGYVLTANSGETAGVKWEANGNGTLTGVGAGSNIGVNNAIPTAPVVSLLSPLTSTLNLGTQNCQGTSSQITLTNGGSQANATATLGFTSVVSATPTTKANLFNTSISIETSTNKVAITPTSILKSVGSSTFTIGSSIAPLSLVGNNASADSIQIQQAVNNGTTLTTNLSNVKWYPDTLINNNGTLSPTAVPAPQVISQRLTLTNYGLTDLNFWIDYGATTGGSATTAFGVDSGNNIWIASADGICRVYDSTITTLLHTITLTYLGNPATINVLYYSGGYMFIGGQFDTINGNPSTQYSIARVSTSSYTEDIMEDPLSVNHGFTIGSEVYCMTDVNGALVCGGSFTTDALGTTTILRVGSISNPYIAGTAQTWTEWNGGVDNVVYAIYHEPSNNNTYIGGAFTQVNVNNSAIGDVYGAGFNNGSGSWFAVAGNNFNQPVYTIQYSNQGGMIWTGSFNGSPIGTQDYNCYIDPNTQVVSDTTFNMGGYIPNYKQRNYTAGGNALIGFDNTLYKNTSYQVWESLGQTGGSGNVIGIDYWNGDWKVILNSYVEVRSHGNYTHAQTFNSGGIFKYNGTLYVNYTITTKDISQQFIGDPTNAFWSPIGTLVGAFS